MDDNKPFNWRDHIKVHPAADLFPLLSETDPTALKDLAEDIKKNDLRSSIVMWAPSPDAHHEAVVLDGRNRLDAMQMAGIEMFRAGKGGRFEVRRITLYGCSGGPGELISPFTGASLVADPYEYVISANIHRRHLTAEQKRDLIAKLLKANPGKSDRSIAKLAKTSPTTVGAVRSTVQSGQLKKRIGADGKARKQPAKKQIQPKKNNSPKPSSQEATELPAPPEKRTSGLPTGSQSKPHRWNTAVCAAVEALCELQDLQEEYLNWREGLPENFQDTALAERLDQVCDLDIQSALDILNEAEGLDLPLGFGRDE